MTQSITDMIQMTAAKGRNSEPVYESVSIPKTFYF